MYAVFLCKEKLSALQHNPSMSFYPHFLIKISSINHCLRSSSENYVLLTASSFQRPNQRNQSERPKQPHKRVIGAKWPEALYTAVNEFRTCTKFFSTSLIFKLLASQWKGRIDVWSYWHRAMTEGTSKPKLERKPACTKTGLTLTFQNSLSLSSETNDQCRLHLLPSRYLFPLSLSLFYETCTFCLDSKQRLTISLNKTIISCLQCTQVRVFPFFSWLSIIWRMWGIQ